MNDEELEDLLTSLQVYASAYIDLLDAPAEADMADMLDVGRATEHLFDRNFHEVLLFLNARRLQSETPEETIRYWIELFRKYAHQWREIYSRYQKL